MNNLNTQQIILLALLVSFVTSIATGITTVSLLQQAPDPVTQTINRVVEKTIERVVTEPNENNEKTVEKEIVTVVVNEEDRTIEAIEKNSESLVRIYEKIGELKNFVALGVILSSNGEIVTDASLIKESGKYLGVYGINEFPIQILSKATSTPFIKMGIDSEKLLENSSPSSFVAVSFGDSNISKLGQSVISLSGAQENKVSIGVITSINNDEGGKILTLDTSIDENNILPGSVILNLSGEVIGMISNANILKSSSFIPANIVKDFLSSANLLEITD